MNDLSHQDLTYFRQTVTWKQTSFADHTWDYVIGGEGDVWILLLHGGGVNSESFFPHFAHLSPYFRLIIPTLPNSVDRMTQVVDGLVALLDSEDIHKTHVYGPSLGGMVAQVFACYQPDRVERCVFSHTSLPQPEQSKIFNKALTPLKLTPYWLLRYQMTRSIRSNLPSDIPDITPEEIHFWINYLQTLYTNTYRKAHMISAVRLQIDYHERVNLSSCLIRSQPERVMLIFHENDVAFTSVEQSTMKDFYTQAAFHQLPVYGHLGAMVRSKEITQRLKGFFNDTVMHEANE